MSLWTEKAISADDAVAHIASGMRVFIHGAAATPTPLIDALSRRRDLEGVSLYHLHTAGPAPFAEPEHEGRFLSVSLFTGAPLRHAIDEGRADFVPIFLSDIPRLFTTRAIPLDAAIVQLSPPDRHGYCTLGTSVDAALAAALSARLIIAEINERMPRTLGNTLVPFSRVGAFIHTDRPLHTHPSRPPTPQEEAIGEHAARLVPDGATLQMGIGAIPDAVLRRLVDKHDLGIHTEMFSDGVVDLVEAGAITNRRKHVHPGRIVTSFVIGTERLYRFVHDNPFVEFHPCDRTNDTSLIRKNDFAVAINSALEVDLSGQVCADSIGFRNRRRRKILAHCIVAEARVRRRDDAGARSLGGDRIRRGEPVRPVPAAARRSADRDRPSGFSRRAAPRVRQYAARSASGIAAASTGDLSNCLTRRR
jgi:acyl-CoA hydrolase